MQTILCYGDSNTWGCQPLKNLDHIPRYGPEARWGSVMRTTLGDGYWVVEEGLNGRTTVFPDPVEGEYKSGKTYLPACLESHQPIDLVALMLGSNDLKHKFGLSAWDIASGVGVLVDMILNSPFGPDGAAPQVLLICPAPVSMLTFFSELFAGAAEKSPQLARYYKEIAEQRHCGFLDAGQVVVTSERDGLHLEAAEQQKLGKAVAMIVQEMLGK